VATTAAADVTGIILASAVAAIGFFILPAKRQKGKAEMRKKITAMREQLADSLRAQFEREFKRSGERIRESVAPYSRFVRAEGEKLSETATVFRAALASLQTVREELDKQIPDRSPRQPTTA
jgi:hypothetical protein